jgi:hypothetical protein
MGDTRSSVVRLGNLSNHRSIRKRAGQAQTEQKARESINPAPVVEGPCRSWEATRPRTLRRGEQDVHLVADVLDPRRLIDAEARQGIPFGVWAVAEGAELASEHAHGFEPSRLNIIIIVGVGPSYHPPALRSRSLIWLIYEPPLGSPRRRR